jgi:hypothetical protein
MSNKKISSLTAASVPLAGTEVLPIVQSGATVKVSVDDLTAGKTVYGSTFSASSGSPGFSISNQGTSAARIQGTNTGGTFYFGLDSSGGGLFSAYAPTLYYSGNYPILMGNNGTLQFTIDTSGNIKANVGNFIQGTAAKGVNFTANTGAAGMTSQLLNWYEEGTWTPTDQSGAGLTLAANGFYTRVGRLVNWQAAISYPVTASGVDSLIGGLPFTIAGGAGSQGRSGAFVSLTDATALVHIMQVEATTTVRPYKALLVRATNTDLSGKSLYIAGFYVV